MQTAIAMIAGTGIDIVEVERIVEKITKSGFREKVFSKHEIDFCESKGGHKAEHYAARFCAKEAFLKATGLGMLLTNDLCEIEVVSTDNGRPEFSLSGSAAKMAVEKKWKVYLSLSHTHTTACAMVVIESDESAAR